MFKRPALLCIVIFLGIISWLFGYNQPLPLAGADSYKNMRPLKDAKPATPPGKSIENAFNPVVRIYSGSKHASGFFIRIKGELKVVTAAHCVGRFRCKEIEANELGIQGWIQGTGYTGERGVEIFVDNSSSKLLWDEIISAGPSEVSPVGLGARDTLRLEMGYLLSGQDFLWPGLGNDNSDEKKHSLSRNTVETAVPFGLEISHDFIGKQRTEYLLDKGQRWTGLVCKDRGPSPRSGHEVFSSGDEGAKMLGFVTSGAPSPSLGMQGIAMAYLDQVDLPDEVWIQTSGRRRIRAAVKKPPFV